MFNFMNIDEIEFEEICKEILEKKTGKSFRVFGRGQDGGIDIQSNEDKKIVGQVKLYLNTSQSNTVNKIKKEINRMKHYPIKRYYLFIGREMSPQSIEEIYEDAEGIIKTKEDIFTLKEINELLNKEEYADIVQHHLKLWICSTNILEQINNRNIFLDCEILLDNIKEDVNLFVQTDLYRICQDILDKDRLLLILGMPGIGKTMISKMLVLYYAQKGYTIRYSNSNNLEELKRALSFDKEKKELIFLDDCLGQRYLELHEQTENEIINLIKYVKRLDNKMLLLNSRITIFQEAKSRKYELGKCINNTNLQIQVVNIENISDLEKARIFHHYLIGKQLPKQYLDEIIKNNNYMKIIKDTSFSPRIIDYMTEKKNYIQIQPQKYVEALKDSFKKSDFVWKDEFENKIDLQDRIFLTVLFSISDYEVKEEILKKAFYERLKLENIDTSLPVYERVLERLNESFIKIGIKNGKRVILVINPSVNDFMKKELESNNLEKHKILNSATTIEQIHRFSNSQKEYDEIIKEKISKDEFLNLETNSNSTIEALYLTHLIYYNMLDKLNHINFKEAVFSLTSYTICDEYIGYIEMIKKLWHSNFYTNQIKDFFMDGKNLIGILYYLSLSDEIEILQTIYENNENVKIKNEDILLEYLTDEFNLEPQAYSASELAIDCGLRDIVTYEVEELKQEYEYAEKWNIASKETFKKELIENVKDSFFEACVEEVQYLVAELYSKLPDRLYNQFKCPEVERLSFDEKEFDDIIRLYVDNVDNDKYKSYKNYTYDGHLLNKTADEEIAINSIFRTINNS